MCVCVYLCMYICMYVCASWRSISWPKILKILSEKVASVPVMCLKNKTDHVFENYVFLIFLRRKEDKHQTQNYSKW